MPLAEGRAGAGLLLRQNFNDINDNFMIIIIIKKQDFRENAARGGPSWRRVASSAKQLLGQDLKTLPRRTSEF